jgi:hypothetical protein
LALLLQDMFCDVLTLVYQEGQQWLQSAAIWLHCWLAAVGYHNGGRGDSPEQALQPHCELIWNLEGTLMS